MELILILMLPALLIASGLASGAETALFSLTYADRTRLARSNPATSAAVASLLKRPRMLLLTILFLNNAVNVTYFVIVSVLAWRVAGTGLGTVVSVGCLLLIVLLGEVLAKLLAARFRVTYCRLFAPALLAIHSLLGPVRGALNAVVEPLMRLAAPGREAAHVVTPRELEALLEQHARFGVIDETERRILAGVVALGTSRVRDVMTPRVDVEWLRDDMTDDRILEAVGRTRASVLPLCRESPDNEVLGVLSAHRYFAARDAGRPRAEAMHAATDPPVFVPETARLDQLLDLFHRKRAHMALCVDEQGSVSGIVQIEHVVRDLLLSHADERAGQDELVRRVSDSAWSVSGRLSVRDWDELIGGGPTDTSTGARFGTIAGLVMARLGRVPSVGDSVTVGGMRITVESMDGLAIERVRVQAEEPVA